MQISDIVIMYLLFPVCILLCVRVQPWGVRRGDILTREDSTQLRGIAAIMVMVAHYTDLFYDAGLAVGILEPFRRLGPMGVAIFLFLSGYGLSKSKRAVTRGFFPHRCRSALFPYILIYLCFLPVLGLPAGPGEFLAYVLGYVDAWFVFVITALYLCYYLVRRFVPARGQVTVLFLLTIGLSVALFFLKGAEKEFWYANNLCFPIGFVCGKHQERLMTAVKKAYWPVLIGVGMLFAGSIVFYDKSGLSVAVLGKTGAGVCIALLAVLLTVKFELRSPVMRWCGVYSLYLYIVHLRLLHLIVGTTGAIHEKRLILLLGASALLSFVFKWVYERIEQGVFYFAGKASGQGRSPKQ